MSSNVDKKNVLTAFINILRWVRAVLDSDELSAYALPHKQPVTRPSPYGVDMPTEIVAHRGYVIKKIYLPKEHFANFHKVYKFLGEHKDKPFVVRVDIIWVAKTPTAQGDDRTHFMQTGNIIPRAMQKEDGVWITLSLVPVGGRFVPRYSDVENGVNAVSACFIAILSLLCLLHAAGLVHRDLRWPNILRVAYNRWMIIDFELASEENQNVFWTGEALPKVVETKERGYTKQDDMWQVSRLLLDIQLPPAWDTFKRDLPNLTATEALHRIQTL